MKRGMIKMVGKGITGTLTAHDHEIRSLKHRINDLEEQNKTIQDLVLTVRELALNMTRMIEEQKAQGKRLDKLEGKSGEEWEAMKKHLIHTILGVLAAGATSGIVYLIAQSF